MLSGINIEFITLTNENKAGLRITMDFPRIRYFMKARQKCRSFGDLGLFVLFSKHEGHISIGPGSTCCIRSRC
jgi:hypothetical protein